METKLNDNEVKEIAKMQQKIDSYEGFIHSCYMMAKSGKEIKIPLIIGTDFDSEMNYIWRFVRDYLKYL